MPPRDPTKSTALLHMFLTSCLILLVNACFAPVQFFLLFSGDDVITHLELACLPCTQTVKLFQFRGDVLMEPVPRNSVDHLGQRV